MGRGLEDAVSAAARPAIAVRQIGPARLTKGLEGAGRLGWDAHRALHPVLRPLTSAQLAALCEAGRLHGRGGDAFPFARKVRRAADGAARRRACTVVLVNGVEGEPGSAKDAVLLRRAPHLVLDGAALAATALGSLEVVVAVADEEAARSAERAITERGIGARARTVRLPGRPAAGEAGALIRGVNADTPVPAAGEDRAAARGVRGLPTLLSSAETYAQLAVLAGLGPRAYAAAGTPDEPGTVLLTVTGAARFPAVVETPAGAPLGHLIDLCGAGASGGVLVGGYRGAWLSGEAVTRTRVSRAGLAASGGVLGAGTVMPLGRGTCPLGECARVARYLAAGSTGRCGPCRAGLPGLAAALEDLAAGRAVAAARDAVLETARTVTGGGACTHHDGAVRFALTALEVFEGDIARHRAGGGCGRPVRGVLPAGTGAGMPSVKGAF